MTDVRLYATKATARRRATIRTMSIRDDWNVRAIKQVPYQAYNLPAYQQYLVPAGGKLGAYIVEATGEVAAPGEPPRFVARVVHVFAYPLETEASE
jgi:hypothetical protein